MSKQKSKKAFAKKKKEFRYHKIVIITDDGKKTTIRHPTYVFLQKGNAVSITHSNNVSNRTVVRLRINPNPKDKRNSYRVVGIKIDTRDRFGKIQKNWKMDPADDEEIRDEYKKR